MKDMKRELALVTSGVLLGAALETGAVGVEPSDVEAAMRERLPEKLWEVNTRALHYMQNR